MHVELVAFFFQIEPLAVFWGDFVFCVLLSCEQRSGSQAYSFG